MAWLLMILGAVAGSGHPVFQKGYVPPARPATADVQPVLLDNSDGFWDNARP